MGHSLGEYGALVAAGILPFAEALEAAAGRGREMARVKMDDNGWMAAVLAPYEVCLLYTSPSPRDRTRSRMPSSA